jgi:apolipoprotein D and lipocalin family protein
MTIAQWQRSRGAPARRALGVAAMTLVSVAPAAALTPSSEFQVSQYQGYWYEIASIPGFFQGKCARDTRAEYVPEEGGALIVRNRCVRPDGGEQLAEGRARVLDPALPAVLKVTFVNQFGIWWYPFGRNQVVIAAGRNNQWIVIGEPSLHYGRILSRQPTLSDEALRAAVAALAAEKYDLCRFVFKPQTGGRTQASRLCDEG